MTKKAKKEGENKKEEANKEKGDTAGKILNL